MSELLPCPFCGRTDGLSLKRICIEPDVLYRHAVICTKCSSSGSKEYTAEKAVERWNTRNYPAAVVIAEKQTEYHPDGYVFLVRCPCCNSEINYIGYRLQETAVKHCGECGKKMIIKFQALDWSEE